MNERTHVAVYGTLKEGHENHERLLPGERPILRITEELPYRMYASRDYPMLVPSTDRNPVALEIYSVGPGTLEKLDALEAPYGYRREAVFLGALGANVEIYVHPGPPPDGFAPVPGGDWTGA